MQIRVWQFLTSKQSSKYDYCSIHYCRKVISSAMHCYQGSSTSFVSSINHIPGSRSTMWKVKHLPRVQPPAKFVHEFCPLISPTLGINKHQEGFQERGGNGFYYKWTILLLGFLSFYWGPPLFSQWWFERPLKIKKKKFYIILLKQTFIHLTTLNILVILKNNYSPLEEVC